MQTGHSKKPGDVSLSLILCLLHSVKAAADGFAIDITSRQIRALLLFDQGAPYRDRWRILWRSARCKMEIS